MKTVIRMLDGVAWGCSIILLVVIFKSLDSEIKFFGLIMAVCVFISGIFRKAVQPQVVEVPLK